LYTVFNNENKNNSLIINKHFYTASFYILFALSL